MNPLSGLYGAIVQSRNRRYDRGSLKSHTLRGPVVSIGNVTVGGSGKTPFLIALGELLQQRGIVFDVLSRGYGRATKGIALVRPEGAARDFGDEPLLIARKLQVPVIVGEDRYAAGQFAERKFGPQLHLLDDGFQHRRLARDFDIVLVTATDAHDALLPIGRLREPLSSLARADAIVLTNGALAEGLRVEHQQVWRVRRGIVPPDTKEPCFAFAGIARPQSFFAELQAAGVELVGTRKFPDHHAYNESNVRRLLALRKQHEAAAFVTTEKDAINLGPALARLEKVHVVPVSLQLENAEEVVNQVLASIAGRNRRPA